MRGPAGRTQPEPEQLRLSRRKLCPLPSCDRKSPPTWAAERRGLLPCTPSISTTTSVGVEARHTTSSRATTRRNRSLQRTFVRPGEVGESTLCNLSSGLAHPGLATSTPTFPGDTTVPDPAFPGLSVGGAQTNAAVSRLLSGWGGSITGISPVTYTGPFSGNSSADLTVTFTIDPTTNQSCHVTQGDTLCPMLLAWGGHLGKSSYWNVSGGGVADGAATISGSSFHMRTQNLDNGGGAQQDRSMQTTAVSAPPNLVTDVSPNTATINSPVTDTASLQWDPRVIHREFGQLLHLLQREQHP